MPRQILNTLYWASLLLCLAFRISASADDAQERRKVLLIEEIRNKSSGLEVDTDAILFNRVAPFLNSNTYVLEGGLLQGGHRAQGSRIFFNIALNGETLNAIYFPKLKNRQGDVKQSEYIVVLRPSTNGGVEVAGRIQPLGENGLVFVREPVDTENPKLQKIRAFSQGPDGNSLSVTLSEDTLPRHQIDKSLLANTDFLNLYSQLLGRPGLHEASLLAVATVFGTGQDQPAMANPNDPTWTPPAKLTMRQTDQEGGFIVENKVVYYVDPSGQRTWKGEMRPFSVRGTYENVNLMAIQGPNGSWSLYTPNGVRLWSKSYASWSELGRDLSQAHYIGDIYERPVLDGEGRYVGSRALVSLNYNEHGTPKRTMDPRTGQIYNLTWHNNYGYYAPATDQTGTATPPAEASTPKITQVPTPTLHSTTSGGSRTQNSGPTTLQFRQESGPGYALERHSSGKYYDLAYYDEAGNRQVHGWSTRFNVQALGTKTDFAIYFHGQLEPGQDPYKASAAALFAWPSQQSSQSSHQIGPLGSLGTNKVFSRPVVDENGRKAGFRPLIPILGTNNGATTERQYVDLQGNRYFLDLTDHVGVFRPIPKETQSEPPSPTPGRPALKSANAEDKKRVADAVQKLVTAHQSIEDGRDARIQAALQGIHALGQDLHGIAASELGRHITNTELSFRLRADAAWALSELQGLNNNQRKDAATTIFRAWQELSPVTQWRGYDWGTQFQEPFERITRALGRIGSTAQEIDGLQQALMSHAGQGIATLRWANVGRRNAAIEALTAMGVDGQTIARVAVTQLIQEADTDLARKNGMEWVQGRVGSVRLLGQLPVIDTVDRGQRLVALQKAIKDPNETVRKAAEQALQQLTPVR